MLSEKRSRSVKRREEIAHESEEVLGSQNKEDDGGGNYETGRGDE